MLGYVRLNSMGKNERQTEEMLLGILQDILEAQENGVSAQDYFAKLPNRLPMNCSNSFQMMQNKWLKSVY